MAYRTIDAREPLPALEARVLAFWREADVFRKSLELRAGAPEWVFYEGPPTANGKPGIHHVESRTFKDVYPRFRTMTGHYVHRKGGWDCHGLPVELEVEREIGTKTKRDIEAFGIAEFNRRCRESVTRYVGEWERLTERIGFWLDLSEAYWTMSPDYIESVWWSLKRMHEQGLLFEDLKSVAYCPRCGTGLSDHEVALGYATVTDPSVFVRFRLTSGPLAERGAAVLAWTTTPYTLYANVALAVHPEVDYAVVDSGGELLVVAEALATKLFGDDVTIAERVTARDLEGATYEPVFTDFPPDGRAHVIVSAEFVTTVEGTGIVHIAPAFGQDDLDLGKRYGLATINAMDDEGRLTAGPHAGTFVKDAAPGITADLEAEGKLWKALPYEHTYPLCWRCKTPLIYWARPSWYVRTTARKDELLGENRGVGWYPDHIRDGRYGDWLSNNVDWSLSRERYWGTPLPAWRCSGTPSHVTIVGSRAELSELAGRNVSGVDPHRPDIDEVTIACPECGAEARRVSEVIDAWYDSGAMPFAQWGYPHTGEAEFKARFPADFISEAIDQTRGWFYSLMAESVLLFGENSYRNVVCLGHIVDQDGRKMSKSLGNILDPWSVLDVQGADALRWYLLTSGSPWAARRVYAEAVEEVVRRVLLTLRNTHAFFAAYANLDAVDAASLDVPLEDRPPLDRWVLSQLHDTVARARDGLERYDATGAGRRIEQFIDDLSNWWVRRSRRRFWNPAGGEDDDAAKGSAYATLYECLTTLARLLAPFTPFVADDLYRGMVAEADSTAPVSVHLTDYPEADPTRLDPGLDAAMDLVRTVVTLGRAARTDAKVRVRQPLGRAVVHVPGDPARLEPLLDLIADELNVKEVAFAASEGELAGYRAKPSFRALGPRLGPRVKDVAGILSADDGTLAEALAAGRPVTVSLQDGTEVVLGPEEVDLVRETREGWRLASDGTTAVALDLTLSDELRAEGLAREVIRAVQDARKAAGLEITDRIRIKLTYGEGSAQLAEPHVALVTGETLADGIETGDGPRDGEPDVSEAGLSAWVVVEPTGSG